ncbi:MAG TPA: plasmid stabilization protein [Burkholderiaceae bacterium]
MPSTTWSRKRERQYQHIRAGLVHAGKADALASEIAARTVNKERARHGESRTASRTSTHDIASARRGGLRSHTGARGRTYAQLYQEARVQGIPGRSRMNKSELEAALKR